MKPTLARTLSSAALLAALTATATGQVVFSPPALLAGDDAVGPAAGEQSGPVLAAGGNQFLAVWVDRSSQYGGEQTDSDLFGMRLDLAGHPIDATPFPIVVDYGWQRDPRVVWNGSNWLVTFESQEPTQTFYEDRVQAVRVSPQGQVLDAAPIDLFSQGSGGNFELVAVGSQWVIVSQSYDAGAGGIYGRRLAADGQLLDPQPVLLVPPTYFLYSYRALVLGSDLVIAWNTNAGQSAFSGQRFDPNLTPVGAAYSLPKLSLTSNGTGFYTVWITGGNLVGSPMLADGTIVFPSGKVLGSSYQAGFPKITWGGGQWWASWVQINQGIKVARVNAAGNVLDPGGVLVPITTSSTSLLSGHVLAAGANGGAELVFQDAPGGLQTSFYDVAGVAIDPTVAASPKVTLPRSAPHQQLPKLTEGAGQVLCTFVSEVSGERRAMAQRLNPDGSAIDAQPVLVAAHPYIGSVRAAFDGVRYLITWSEDGEIRGRRMATDGTWVDPQPFHVLTGGAPDVAALGGEFLVVGQQVGSSIQYLFPVAQRIDAATGAKVGAPLTLGNSFAQAPRVIAVAGRWLVTWQRNYTHDNPQGDCEAAFVDASGVPTASFVVDYNAFTPAVATSGAEVMFVFRKNSLANANNDIGGRRMLPDGTFPAAPFVVTNAGYKQFSPTITFDGVDYVAAWEDRRNAAAFFDNRTDVYGARIATDGTVLDAQGFPIAAEAAGEARPWLATSGGALLLAASVFRDDPGLTSWRIELRTGTSCAGRFTEYGAACVGSGGFVPGLHGDGCPLSGESLPIAVDQALGGAAGLMLIGAGPGAIPLQGCTLLVSPVLPIVPAFTFGGAGAGNGGVAIPATVPPGAATGSVHLQVFVLDPGVPNGLAATNGLRVDVN